MATFSDLARDAWVTILEQFRDARNGLIVMDDKSAELFHWAGVQDLIKFPQRFEIWRFLDSSVRNLQSAPRTDALVVFVLCAVIGEKELDRITSILSLPRDNPTNCSIFTAYSDELHRSILSYEETSDNPLYFGFMEHHLAATLPCGSSVRITHVPLFHSLVCPGVIVTPAHTTLLFPPRSAGGEESDSTVQIELLAASLSSLLSSLDVHEDVFSLGHLSSLVATQLGGLAETQARRKSAQYRGSLLLVDRTLDLATATSHSLDTLADAVFGLLPRQPLHTTDVAIDMSPLTAPCAGGTSRQLKGSVSQPINPGDLGLVTTLFAKKQKEAAMILSRRLLDTLSEEGIAAGLSAGKLGRGPMQQVNEFVGKFRGHSRACMNQLGLLQLSCAAVQVATHPSRKNWEKLLSVEKVVALCLRDGAVENAFRQVMQVIQEQALALKRASEVVLHSRDILGLCVYLYSLAGPNASVPEQCEDQLQISLCAYLQEAAAREGWVCNAMEQKPPVNEEAITTFTKQRVMPVLHQVQQYRDALKQFRLPDLSSLIWDTHWDAIKTKDLVKQDRPSPTPSLLLQLMDAVYHPSKPPLADVVHHSQGLTEKLKSSLSLFMSSARPRPNSHPLLIVYMIGGITAQEIHLLKEISAVHKSSTQIVVGSSHILKPDDYVAAFFEQQLKN